ncbi:MAG: DUF4419 domain-containing protein [Bacteroidaceae bacterium]|nr:DUF4419 domain-containing protein [Bacteroidaceae bacterium]
MKANRTTFLAIFCLCFFTISFGENATVQKKSKKVLKQTKKSITFVVDEDLPAPTQTFTMLPSDEISSQIISKKGIPYVDHNVVKTSFEGEKLCYLGEDNFFKCIVQAFADHRSLVLSPDMVWLLIGQGFSRYVNAHSEELRDKLVSHQGKMVLKVEKDNDVLNPAKGDWAQLLNDFSSLVAENTKGEVADMMTANFSTTGMDERIASQITLMETVKTYFDLWNVALSCGIPTITLEGTSEDWQKVREKARGLSKYGLEKWSNELDPILAEFVKASEGKPNQAFWENMVMKYRVDKFKSNKLCGGYVPNETTRLDGWFLKFFPNEHGYTQGDILYTESMPTEMARGNFKQEYIDPVTGASMMVVPVQLWAGFVGVQVDEKTGALTPRIGWFARIGDDEQEKLSLLYQLERHGELSYSYLHETDTLPGILAKMSSISKLTLRFNRYPVNIPAWVDNMKIGKLRIDGRLSDAEEAQLRQRFPEAEINNAKKRELIGEDAIKEEEATKVIVFDKTPDKAEIDRVIQAETEGNELPVPTSEKSGSVKAIDMAEFEGIAAYDPYDIRQVLE